MLETLFVAALLSVTDPAGDVGVNLTAPTAAAFRQEDAFDLRNVTVYDTPTLTFSVSLESLAYVPGAILELYFSDLASKLPGAESLLPGSALRLPAGASWRYAFRLVGGNVRVFRGQNGTREEITEASGARLSVTGNTLTITTTLPVPQRLSVYGVTGSYDPFDPDGWRRVRAEPSPWGFSGTATSPALDILTDTPAAQTQALAQGVLPEVRASSSEPGWLALAGAGVALALTGIAVRFVRRKTPTPAAAYLAPFTDRDRRRRARILRNLSRVQGKLTLADAQPTNLEATTPPEPVLN